MSENLVSWMAANKLSLPFTRLDLLLLDHSTNDNHPGFEANNEVGHGIEGLIRTIYGLSEPQSFPNIVLLETDVRPDLQDYFTADYQAVAAHYRLPVWSFRAAALSPLTSKLQSQYTPYLVGEMNTLNQFGLKGVHPPWYMHLMIADVYAGVIRSIFEGCKQNVKSAGSWAAALDFAQVHNRTVADLPKPLFNDTDHPHCSPTMLMSFDFANISQHKVPSAVYQSSPADSWQVSLLSLKINCKLF